MRIEYEEKNFSASSLAVIENANKIIVEYQAQGFILTLRQLYYQFVSRDLISNTIQSYKRIGSIVNDARLAGLVSWEAIEDRTRNLRSLAHWISPSEIMGAVIDQYRIDKWATQPYRPEIWIEKDALVGVIQGICDELDVPYFACRGYNSQSEQWASGRRFKRYYEQDQEPVVFHFGDHDPSGIDMTRDNADRLSLFARHRVNVQRLALNYDQVEKYNPPPNPAKATDARFNSYQAKYGDESWELDALEPQVIVEIVRKAILSIRDDDRWGEALLEESEQREALENAREGLKKASEFNG